jgi:hypothetical protein
MSGSGGAYGKQDSITSLTWRKQAWLLKNSLSIQNCRNLGVENR